MFKYNYYKNSKYDEKNKYYADVSYENKDLAKSLGAKWDWNLKCWYFTDELSRHNWDIKYSDYKIPNVDTNPNNYHFAIIGLETGCSWVQNEQPEKFIGIGIIILDVNYNIISICNYQIKNSIHIGTKYQSNSKLDNITMIINKNDMILDIKTELTKYKIHDVFSYTKRVYNCLPELNEYNWIDISKIASNCNFNKYISIEECNKSGRRKKGYDILTILGLLKNNYYREYYKHCNSSSEYNSYIQSGKLYNGISMCIDCKNIMNLLNIPIEIYLNNAKIT